MKASTVQITSGNEFFTTAIAPITTFMTTVYGLILSVFKKKSAAQTAYFFDRSPGNVGAKARLVFRDSDGAPTINTLITNQGAGHSAEDVEEIATFTGDKVGNLIRFGVGNKTPADIMNALENSVTALALGDESSFGADIVRSVCVPALGEQSLRSVLQTVIDALPSVRVADKVTIVQVRQNQDTGTITVARIPEAFVEGSNNQIDNRSLDVEISAPETDTGLGVQRLWGE